MKHIALDCRLWREGGVGRYIRNLLENLLILNGKHRYHVLCFASEREAIRQFVHRLPHAKNFTLHTTAARWHSLSEQTTFWQELNEGLFDLVHFPYFSHPILYQKPFVVTIHDLTILHHATGKASTHSYPMYLLKRFGYTLTLRHAIYSAARIIVPTRFVEHDVLKHFAIAPDKVVVAHEGVGSGLIDTTVQKSYSTPASFFLYVGNFYPHKNVEFLVRTFARYKGQHSLVLVGPNNSFAVRVQKLIERLALQKKVVFIPNPSDAVLKYLYRHAEALILPSLYEGFGLPVVEGAYCNTPLLLSDIAPFREVAPLGAQFFNPYDSAALLRLLSVPHKKPLSAQASRQYFDTFSFSGMAKKILQVYDELLS